MSDPICIAARANLQAVQDLPIPDELQPSTLWAEHCSNFLLPKILELQSSEEVVAFATSNNAFTFPRSADDPISYSIITNYLRWLELNGSPIQSFDLLVQESAYTPDDMVLTIEGRRLSVLFLWYLCGAHTLLSKTENVETVAEIGAGFGGLARAIKLLRPSVRYYMIDLPQSLYFSYTYLRRNFPSARCLFITNPGMLQSLDQSYDFYFMPVEFLDQIKGLTVDAVLSVSALAEMTQATANRFMRFIQEDISTRYFFSVNRYGHHRDHDAFWRSGRGVGRDCCSVAVHLDQHWRIRWWDLHGSKGFSQIDPIQPPHLELLVERTETVLRDNENYITIGRALLDAVLQASSFGDTEHRYLWDSVRLWPTSENLGLYLKFLSEKNYMERDFYLGLLRAIEPEAADRFEAKGITPIRPSHGILSDQKRLSYQVDLTPPEAPSAPEPSVPKPSTPESPAPAEGTAPQSREAMPAPEASVPEPAKEENAG